MKRAARLFPILLILLGQPRYGELQPVAIGPTSAHRAAAHDTSPPLKNRWLARAARNSYGAAAARKRAFSDSPPDPDDDDEQAPASRPSTPPVTAAAAAVEQTAPGTRPPAAAAVSFDGLGAGFQGPQGPEAGRNPSDNSLAVSHDFIVQIVNSSLAIFSKTGEVLYGAVPTNSIFQGFGGVCEDHNNGDAVVRYDQLADRWLIVMPIFNRIVGRPDEPFSMCYAVSETADPTGSYYRYEFGRAFFPDYPRPAIWPDGYYIPSSSGDNVIQKHACVADRANMLKGRDASEQCILVEGVNFLNAADLDSRSLPPTGAPEIIMAAGGSQLRQILQDDAVYAWTFRVSFSDPSKTRLSDPVKIPVAQYHYLCGGQLSNCVPQPGTQVRLDAQGDKLMQRLVYRNFGDRESIVAVQSVDTAAGAGGVRWYEFRLNGERNPVLYQQGTYAPDRFYRWMPSAAMDRKGNLGIGYSFGGAPNYAGQRFVGRLAGDPLGQLTLRETILAAGAAPQTADNRWEDFTTLAMDPIDDCTMWYVGDYYKPGAANYSTRIGAFRMPGCLERIVSGIVFFDRNGDGLREIGEPGIAGAAITWTSGAQSGTAVTAANGNFNLTLPADPAYGSIVYRIALRPPANPDWKVTGVPVTVKLDDPAGVNGLDFPVVCTKSAGCGPF